MSVRFYSMASIFESAKAFEQRVKVLGLADLMPKFTELGWTKFWILAFASDYVPGSSEPALFVSEVVKPVSGDDEAQQLRSSCATSPC